MSATSDQLQPLLDAAAIGDVADSESLRRLWDLAGDTDPQRLDEFLDEGARGGVTAGLPRR